LTQGQWWASRPPRRRSALGQGLFALGLLLAAPPLFLAGFFTVWVFGLGLLLVVVALMGVLAAFGYAVASLVTLRRTPPPRQLWHALPAAIVLLALAAYGVYAVTHTVSYD
jgi:hypothetical protein